MSEKWNDHGRTAASAVKRGAETTANGIHTATNFVARNDGRIADGAQVVTQVIGGGLDKVGASLASASQRASQSLHGNASRLADAAQTAIVGTGSSNAWRKGAGLLAWGLTKVATHTVGVTANAVTVLGKVTAATGRATERSAPAVGGAVGGVVRAAASTALDVISTAPRTTPPRAPPTAGADRSVTRPVAAVILPSTVTAFAVTPTVWVATLVSPQAKRPAPLRQPLAGPVPTIEFCAASAKRDALLWRD